MNENPLSKLLDLVNFDQELLSIQSKIDKLKLELEHDNKEMYECKIGLVRVEKGAFEAKKIVDNFELEMKSLDQEEKDRIKKLEASSNQREYESLNKEIEQLKKKQHDLEEELLAAWKKLEHENAELKNRQDYCDKKMTSLNTVIEEKMQKITQLKEQLSEQQKGRHEKMKSIPDELLEKYETMYKKVSNPVIPIAKESCSACFYPITQQMLVDLKHGRLIQCKDCFRFLYYPPESIEVISEEVPTKE
jgi:predicted  nucleic acid-binding Zn-ribbon protein